jgi:hypothetical protein
MCQSIVNRALFRVQNYPKPHIAQLREKKKGQTVAPFQFPYIVLHDRGAFFNFNLSVF